MNRIDYHIEQEHHLSSNTIIYQVIPSFHWLTNEKAARAYQAEGLGTLDLVNTFNVRDGALKENVYKMMEPYYDN